MRGARRSGLAAVVVVLALAGCSASGSGASDASGSTTSPPTSSTTTAASVRPGAEAGRLEFRPVLSVAVAKGGRCEATDAGTQGEFRPSQDGNSCYELGPVGFDGRMLSSARAHLDAAAAGWTVEVRVARPHRRTANALLDACYQGGPTCPGTAPSSTAQASGSVAIVFDDVVISAPMVNGEHLADGALQISGAFTAREAKALAQALGGS